MVGHCLVLLVVFSVVTSNKVSQDKAKVVQALVSGHVSVLNGGQNLLNKIDELKKMVAELDKVVKESEIKGSRSKAIYTRWGKKSCPRGATLVYSGYAAGSHYTHRGTASNILCLTRQPEWDEVTNAISGATGYIYGAEYETSGISSTMWKGLNDHDVPCAVCIVRGPSVVNMIPGRKTCLKGWRLEYSGYIMSEYYNHNPSSFTCVDKNPDVAEGGHANKNGLLFYFVTGSCGSLKCPPYVNNRGLTCVVCSL